MTDEELDSFCRWISIGGVVLFPSDTVYGLATAPDSEQGVRRLYALKGRPPARPAAVMFFDLGLARRALPELGRRTTEEVGRLLPGPLTLVLPNPGRRYPLACGPEPERVGLRVPRLTGSLAPLASMRLPILQSSANRSGCADARLLGEVDELIRRGADLELDGGELPGRPSTVVDLTAYEKDGGHTVLREGAASAEAGAAARA